MNTHLRICCPNCQRMLKARPEHLNKRVVCNHCRHPFLARAEDKEPLYSAPRFANDAKRPEQSTSVVTSVWLGAGLAEGDRNAPRGDQPGATGPSSVAADRGRASASPAGEADRLEGRLREANAELERLRLTVKILQADLFTRAADIERLEAERKAAGADSTRLRSALAELERALTDADARHEAARTGWERERQVLAGRAEASLVSREQAERARAEAEEVLRRERDSGAGRGPDLAGRLGIALVQLEAMSAELEAERGRAERLAAELDAARRQADAARDERERHQAEAGQLRAEIEQQRQRREADRQSQQEALAALRQTLAERLQSRTPSPHGPAAAASPAGGGDLDGATAPSPAVAPDVASRPAADAGPVEGRFRVLRDHLRGLHEAGSRGMAARPMATRLSRVRRPDGP